MSGLQQLLVGAADRIQLARSMSASTPLSVRFGVSRTTGVGRFATVAEQAARSE